MNAVLTWVQLKWSGLTNNTCTTQALAYTSTQDDNSKKEESGRCITRPQRWKSWHREIESSLERTGEKSCPDQMGQEIVTAAESASNKAWRLAHKDHLDAYRIANKERRGAYWKAYYVANKARASASQKVRYEANKEYRASYAKEWYVKNKERAVRSRRAYKASNKERLAIARKAWYEANKERVAATHKVWYADNKERLISAGVAYCSSRRRFDPYYRIVCNLRVRYINAIHRAFSSKSYNTLTALGCTGRELMAHFESQFVPGMTIENYGSVWHADHIRPCASFNLTDPAQQAECFHWKNLQPMFGSENLKKSSKHEGKFYRHADHVDL